ncbi:MAG: TlpA disulfide reductase family protein [Candidatus Rokubacteria bacterium]|nr:TlpA disulfide reductase family protein [Candidatus Rokubacteria bacterium]
MATIILCVVMRVLAAAALAFLALSPAPARAAPPAAPAVRMPLLKGGETFDSRALIGKKVLVLRFQASWCKTCAAQAAGLQRVYERYRSRDVEILAIHVDDTEPDVRAFLEAHRATYPVALDPSLRVANRFGFKRAPYTVVVNKRGEIAARLDATADEARLAAAIDAALKPPARRKAPARAS